MSLNKRCCWRNFSQFSKLHVYLIFTENKLWRREDQLSKVLFTTCQPRKTQLKPQQHWTFSLRTSHPDLWWQTTVLFQSISVTTTLYPVQFQGRAPLRHLAQQNHTEIMQDLALNLAHFVDIAWSKLISLTSPPSTVLTQCGMNGMPKLSPYWMTSLLWKSASTHRGAALHPHHGLLYSSGHSCTQGNICTRSSAKTPPTSSSSLSIAKFELRAQTFLVKQKTNHISIFALNAWHTGGIQSVSGEL